MKTLKSTERGFRNRRTVAALALLAAVGSAGSALPVFAEDVTCAIFAPDQIIPGQNFDLRVSRVPGYPGGWFSPTIYIKVSYPTEPGWAFNQSENITIPKMGIIRADFTFGTPYLIYPDSLGGFVPGGTVNIVAMVVEPTTGTPTRTICTATSIIGM